MIDAHFRGHMQKCPFSADRARVNPRAMAMMMQRAWGASHWSLFDRHQPTQTGNSPRPLPFGGV
jgi:hypothetical protein